MSQRIIFPNNSGGIAIITPATDALTLEEIAAKAVPAGAPYRIIDASIIPQDYATRDAWEFDFSKANSVITINPAKIKPQPKRIAYSQWLDLFTEAERAWGFGSNNSLVREMISRATAENSVDLNSPAVAEFLDLCISQGSPLTAARKTRILAGLKPA